MRIILVLLASTVLLACVSIRDSDSVPRDNVVGETGPSALSATLAGDTVAEIMALYPPTNTGFHLALAPTDEYGRGLVAGLRAQGYQVVEAGQASDTHQPAGLHLGYLVDIPAGAEVYRVTAFIGPESINRAYVPTAAGAIAPAGPWSRRQ